MATSKSKSSLSKNAAEGKHFAIVVSRYHEELTQKLLDGAAETLKGFGAKADDIAVFWVPGAFEIPSAARAVFGVGPGVKTASVIPLSPPCAVGHSIPAPPTTP